jgi:lysophospholipase L1-like esterase
MLLFRTLCAVLITAWSLLAASTVASGQGEKSAGAVRANGQAASDAKLPTLYLIGDSTVKNGTAGLQGWGDPIAALFDRTKIHVVNRARGGRSSRTFLTEGLWEKVLAEIKAGDFVLMQFGHNDGGSLASSYRASIKGNGEETQEVTDAKTGLKETVHTYGWYLRKYIADTRAKGATPIVLSPIPRNIWKDDHTVARASADYGRWAQEAAKAEGVAFIDLNELIAMRYEEIGPEKVKSDYFPGDHTHTNAAGAELNAACVVAGLRALKACPLAAFLFPK